MRADWFNTWSRGGQQRQRTEVAVQPDHGGEQRWQAPGGVAEWSKGSRTSSLRPWSQETARQSCSGPWCHRTGVNTGPSVWLLFLGAADTVASSQLLSCLMVWLLCWTVSGSLEGPSYQPEPFLPRIAWILTADRPWAKTRPLLYTHSVKNSLGSSWTKNYLTFLLLPFLRGRSQQTHTGGPNPSSYQ